MGSLVGKVETKNGQPRFESSQLRQVSRLRHGDSASCFHPGHTIDSRNQRGQANPLDQFYGLFGSLWYFYVLATGLSGFALIYYRRSGGYIPAAIMSVLSIGTTVPDVLGVLPPSAPTLRTTVLMLSVLPLAFVLVYVSWRGLHIDVAEGSSSGISTTSKT